MSKKVRKATATAAKKTPRPAEPPYTPAARPAARVAKQQRAQATSAPPERPTSKAAAVLSALRQPRGATLADLMQITGWQAHSVRGYLSGTVRKRLGLALVSDRGGDGHRYRIANASPRS